ncbi:MAG: redoxin [Planctomycetota bacterium]|nr:MAG: redoxin [Planctomycetota bacterium]
MRVPALALLLAATLGAFRALAESTPVAIGTKVDNFTLRDYHGQPVSLDEVGKDKVVVMAFLGTECPLAKLYASRLNALADKYKDQGVVFLGLDANRQDAVTEIAAFARVHDIKFPILKDLNQVVADAVGATRTPEAVVLDKQGQICYRGRIDDQYGFNEQNANYQKPEPEKEDLALAIDAALAGNPVALAETRAPGCLIGRNFEPVADSEVTYSNQIARIMNANCVFCHREGQIAPFTLTNYEEVAGWASMIHEVVQLQRMPPWHANEKYGHFKNDARLSDSDKELIAQWVDAGAPEGDPADLPAPPKFAEGWMIPEPEEVVYMRDEPFEVPATGVVDYQHFVVDPGWTEDRWISAIEPRPGNPAVVHHILLFVLPPGGNLMGLGSSNDFLGAYAPGLRPEPLGDGLARFVPAGSKLIFQMHYTPNGSKQTDRSYCGFVFAEPGLVKKEVRVHSASNHVFRIPPGDPSHVVKARYVFFEDTQLLTLMPHMHLRGKAFRYQAIYPDGRKEVLLDIPNYDFGWQTNYRLAEPKFLPRGTRMDCYAMFDNSEDNLNNPDPTKTVGFGDQTWDEMMIGFFESMPAGESLLAGTRTKEPMSRLERFAVILTATKGVPDEDLRVGAYRALANPNAFRGFSHALRRMVPMVDRVCVTTVEGDKVVELKGLRSNTGGDSENSPHDQKPLAAPLPEAEADERESLARYIEMSEPVVNNDLRKAPGKLMAEMRKRGALSSMHVPAKFKGQDVTINFWSTDADAFPAPAQRLLAGAAQVMTAQQAEEKAGGKAGKGQTAAK